MDLDLPKVNDRETSADGTRPMINTTIPKVGSQRHQIDAYQRDTAVHVTITPGSKWKRLQPSYSDRYVELFRETFEARSEGFDTSRYQSSQLGAATWEASEKARLFDALPSVGRHNLPLLTKHVRTKSQLDVKQYLDRLQHEELDRQLLEKQTRNVTQADIPAAIEIGPECEDRLEQTADSLAAFQEQYDNALGQRDSSSPFIVTTNVAVKLDAATDEAADTRREDEEEPSSRQPHQMFHLRTLIELSEKLFMHGSRRCPDNHWSVFAEEGETPAVTQQVITDLHELVVSLVRRLVQTILFLAQSRLQATTTNHHRPPKTIRSIDVQSALNVLNLPGDIWGYWTKLPRRAGFKIIAGTRRKGDSVKIGLDYDAVEAALSVRRFSGRRRSLSVGSAASGGSDSGSDILSVSSITLEETQSDADPGSEVPIEDSDAPEDNEMQDEFMSSEDEKGDAPATKAPATPRFPMNKRKRLLEEELDQYLEDLDQLARQDEESRITSLLDFESINTIKQEAIELGRRPKVLRKTVEEVKIWTGPYQAAWLSCPVPRPGDEAVGAQINAQSDHGE